MRALKAKADVSVELAELSWADVSLMLDLMMLARRLRMQDRRLALLGAQPQVAALVELVGLDRMPGVELERPEPVAAYA